MVIKTFWNLNKICYKFNTKIYGFEVLFMVLKNVFLGFLSFVLLIFVGCNEENPHQKNQEKSQENNATLENNITKKPKQEEEILQDSPLQQQLKKNLKSHLNDLSKELQQKNLNYLQLEQNTGLQKHIEHFESLYDRKDIPKNNATTENLNHKIQKAQEFQQERIEKLRQKNDEISK